MVRGAGIRLSATGASRFAKDLGKTSDAGNYEKRGQAYRHYFDPKIASLPGKMKTDRGDEPFDPFLTTS